MRLVSIMVTIATRAIRRREVVVVKECNLSLKHHQNFIKMSSEAANPVGETQASTNQNSSDFENTKPGKEDSAGIHNPGNPVFSCLARTNYSMKVETPPVEDCFQGYGSKPTNPMYLTSSMEYGSRSPTVHTMPTSFHAKCQKFTAHLGQCGMYRNHSLNTASDKSIV